MPRGSSSRRSLFVSDQAADLLAEYNARVDVVRREPMDNTLISAPPPSPSMIGAKAEATLRIPNTLVSNIARPLVATLVLRAETANPMPALLTTVLTSGRSRAAPYTLAAPASRNARVYAAPIPRLAPVTKTVAPRTFMLVPSWVVVAQDSRSELGRGVQRRAGGPHPHLTDRTIHR